MIAFSISNHPLGFWLIWIFVWHFFFRFQLSLRIKTRSWESSSIAVRRSIQFQGSPTEEKHDLDTQAQLNMRLAPMGRDSLLAQGLYCAFFYYLNKVVVYLFFLKKKKCKLNCGNYKITFWSNSLPNTTPNGIISKSRPLKFASLLLNLSSMNSLSKLQYFRYVPIALASMIIFSFVGISIRDGFSRN